MHRIAVIYNIFHVITVISKGNVDRITRQKTKKIPAYKEIFQLAGYSDFISFNYKSVFSL